MSILRRGQSSFRLNYYKNWSDPVSFLARARAVYRLVWPVVEPSVCQTSRWAMVYDTCCSGEKYEGDIFQTFQHHLTVKRMSRAPLVWISSFKWKTEMHLSAPMLYGRWSSCLSSSIKLFGWFLEFRQLFLQIGILSITASVVDVYLGALLRGALLWQAEILSHSSGTRAVNTQQKVLLSRHLDPYPDCKYDSLQTNNPGF